MTDDSTPYDFDLLLRNGWVVNAEGTVRADVGVLDGTIVAVGAGLDPTSAAEVLDVAGKRVLPGVIDPHVHLSVGGADDDAQVQLIVDDLEPESCGAAFGGVTTMLAMINMEGPYGEALKVIADEAAERSYVNCGATVIVGTAEHVEEIPDLARFGISGFKHFMNPDYGGFRLVTATERILIRSLAAITEVGGFALGMVHAEDSDMNDYLEEQLRARTDASDLRALADARPGVSESLRMHYVAAIARHLGARLHIVHCTSEEGLLSLTPFINEGVNISVEAVTANLCATHEAWERVGIWGKFSPPIRGRRHQRALWDGIRSGRIQHIASDHAVWTAAQKENGGGRFGPIWDAHPGIANGMEHLLPAAITFGVRTGAISWEQLVALTSTNTAARFGYTSKGRIAVGFDADIVVVDGDRADVVDRDYYHGRGADNSLFWGDVLYGTPDLTVCGGKVICRDGQLTGARAGAFAPAGG
ncbi:MAG: dihydroorotase [Acidimicrobiia bacterium]